MFTMIMFTDDLFEYFQNKSKENLEIDSLFHSTNFNLYLIINILHVNQTNRLALVSAKHGPKSVNKLSEQIKRRRKTLLIQSFD